MVLGEVSQGAGGAGGGGAMAEGARARLTELEVRLPWTSVKKSWGPRREQWVSQVLSTLACDTLANLVLLLEGAIKTETFDPSWPDVRDEWKARVSAARTPEAIDQVVMQLERAIQWKGIQLNRAGTIARPLPAPSICDDPSLPPPDGIPRASLRIMLILRAMGIRSYSPAVVIQLCAAQLPCAAPRRPELSGSLSHMCKELLAAESCPLCLETGIGLLIAFLSLPSRSRPFWKIRNHACIRRRTAPRRLALCARTAVA